MELNLTRIRIVRLDASGAPTGESYMAKGAVVIRMDPYAGPRMGAERRVDHARRLSMARWAWRRDRRAGRTVWT